MSKTLELPKLSKQKQKQKTKKQKKKIQNNLGQVSSKKLFRETIIYQIFETISSFQMKEHATGKVQNQFFYY